MQTGKAWPGRTSLDVLLANRRLVPLWELRRYEGISVAFEGLDSLPRRVARPTQLAASIVERSLLPYTRRDYLRGNCCSAPDIICRMITHFCDTDFERHGLRMIPGGPVEGDNCVRKSVWSRAKSLFEETRT